MSILGNTISTPTQDLPERVQEDNNYFHHLMPHLRVGRISGEIFRKTDRQRIPVDHDACDDGYDPLTVKAAKVKADPDIVVDAVAERKQEDSVAKARARKKGDK